MYLNYKGFPEEDDLVICKVKSIYRNAVFVKLVFYNKEGMINISEIAPGIIRNIRDHVTDDKIIVCKVLHVDKEKNHLNLSLRRVNEKQRKEKLAEMKSEQKAEKIVDFIAHLKKIDAKKLYEEVAPKIFNEYDTLFDCFKDVVIGEVSLSDLGIESKLAKEFEDVIKERISPPEVFIKGKLSLRNFSDEGVERVKEVLSNIKSFSEKIELTYRAGGKYNIIVRAPNYKEAENIILKITEFVEELQKNKEYEVEFIREKK